MSRLLKPKGYIIETAKDGKQALELIDKCRFDLVLLDIKMPGMDGIEVLKIIRESYSMERLPVIMVSVADESRDIVQALNLGANDYVKKPLRREVTLARIQTQLVRKRAEEKIQRLNANLEQRVKERTLELKTANESLTHEVLERKKAEQQLQEAKEQLERRVERRTAKLYKMLQEREVLLGEIHNRVKNNMALIASLIKLQMDFSSDSVRLEIFSAAINRIYTMELIHEHLYQTENFSRINFNSFIPQLARNLISSYLDDPQQIELKISVDNVSVDINCSILCGLIVNELLSNALKHAFVEGQPGQIEIAISEDIDEKITLKVMDNGVGITEQIDFENPGTLGFTIIKLLVEQLHGCLELDQEKGNAFIVSFARYYGTQAK